MSDPRISATAAAVAALDPVDDREARSQIEILDGLDTLDDPFDEHAGQTHVTGSALIATPEGIILLKHKRLGIWLQPGGHVDGEEWPFEAAVREAREETGLAVSHRFSEPLLLHVDAHDGGRGHRHLDLRYVLTAPREQPNPGPDESQECRWFDWDEAAATADDGLRGALGRLRNVATGGAARGPYA